MAQHPEFRHSDDLPPTLAGPANDATEFLPPTPRDTPELAWSQDETVEIVYPSWRETYGTAAVITACCAVAAFVITVVGWALSQHDRGQVPELPAGDATPVLAPAPAAMLPPTPTAQQGPPTCTPGHNADRGCLPVVNDPDVQPPVKTMVPTPAAAPAPVTPAPIAAPSKPSQADLDERYLSDLTASGLRITDVSTVITGAHNVCRFLAAGHSETEAVGVAMRTNSSLTEANAHAMVDNAVLVYCPDQTD